MMLKSIVRQGLVVAPEHKHPAQGIGAYKIMLLQLMFIMGFIHRVHFPKGFTICILMRRIHIW